MGERMNRQETALDTTELQNKENDQILMVKNYIYSLLEEEKIQIGDRLPSEKALSEQLDVSKSLVRDALQSLKSVGLLSSVRGSGYRLTPDFDYSLADILHAMVVYSSGSRRHIREVREALEMKELELIIEMEDIQDLISEIEEQTNVMLEIRDKDVLTDEDANRLVKADLEFHRLLAHGCNNLFIRSFNIALNEYHDTNTKVTADNVRQRVTIELLDSHFRILDSIRNKELKKGVEAIHDHYAIGDRVTESKKAEGDPILQSTIEQLQKKGFSRQQIMEKLMELA